MEISIIFYFSKMNPLLKQQILCKMTMIVFLFIFCFISTSGILALFAPCNYTIQSQCGDAEDCRPNLKTCYCGGFGENKRINILNSDHYCCVPPPKNESWCYSGYSDTYLLTYCTKGEVISKSVPCQGNCYNDYKINYDKSLGPQAMFQCTVGKIGP